MTTINPNTSKQEYKDTVAQIHKLNGEIYQVDAKFAQFKLDEVNLLQQALSIKDKIIDKRTRNSKTVDISEEQKLLSDVDSKFKQLNDTKMKSLQELSEKYGQMSELKDKLINLLEIVPKKSSKLQDKISVIEEDKDEEEDNA